MPRQVDSQRTGREGERWFAAALPADWILQPPLDDVGSDGVVVICEEGPLNGLEFRVQIKASSRWRVENGEAILNNVNRDAALYWLTGFTPTLLALYDKQRKCGYCAWANQALATQTGVLRGKQKRIQVRLSSLTPVSNEIWPRLGLQLRALNAAISRRISTSETALPIFKALHSLASTLRGFDFAQNATKPDGELTESDKILMWQMEVSCHRDVVRTVRTLDADLRESGVEVDGVRAFSDEYVAHCSQFIDGFTRILERPDGIEQIAVLPDEMQRRRLGFWRSVVDLMIQVTTIAAGAQPAASEPHRKNSDDD